MKRFPDLDPSRVLRASTFTPIALVCAPLLAQDTDAAVQEEQRTSDIRNPIADALAEVDEAVREYNDHLTILASPWMEGRLPGTRGMELAKEYMEFHFRKYGLQAPYDVETESEDGMIEIEEGASFRQPFELGSRIDVHSAKLTMTTGGKALEFDHATLDRRRVRGDFSVTGMGVGGEVQGELAFVGYGIEKRDGEFTSFADDQDLSGKIALLLRYEPMDENGRSLWQTSNRPWSPYAQFRGKLSSVASRGPAAIIIMNPPLVKTPISAPGTPSMEGADVPVLHMTSEAANALVAMATNDLVDLETLVAKANEGPVDVPLEGTVHIRAEVERTATIAENIIGVLPGRGPLANERIVIGAHLDHLGMGEFASRDERQLQGKALHPGADDNASGAAGILHIAKRMVKNYEDAPGDANLRTIVFIGFSAEESGLDGSQYYVENPIGSIEDHVLMMNFDMIGRMKDSRLSLSGTHTGNGLAEFIEPIVEESPLTVVTAPSAGGGSDHRVFYNKGVPVLFSIIKDFHADYHTSRDVSWRINRVEAVHAANLFHDIAWAYSGHEDRFEYVTIREIRRAEQRREEAERPSGSSRVQFGIKPDYSADEASGTILVQGISEGSPAEAAGLLKGDVLTRWNGEKLRNLEHFGTLLRKSEVGDVVEVTLMRDGEEKKVEVTLRAR